MEKIVYINSEFLGTGSDELGKILIRNFLLTLADSGDRINAFFLVNSGVKLACEGSHVLDVLKKISEAGTLIYSCGTCLDYFGLKSALVCGAAGNMKMLAAGLSDEKNHVIRP